MKTMFHPFPVVTGLTLLAAAAMLAVAPLPGSHGDMASTATLTRQGQRPAAERVQIALDLPLAAAPFGSCLVGDTLLPRQACP